MGLSLGAQRGVLSRNAILFTAKKEIQKSLHVKKRFRRKSSASSTLTFLHRKEQPQSAHLSGMGLRPFTMGEVGVNVFNLLLGRISEFTIELGLQFGSCVFFRHTCIKGDY